jgi:tight adherence protein C
MDPPHSAHSGLKEELVSVMLDTLRSDLGNQPLTALAFVLLIAAAVFAFSLGVAALVLTVANPLRRRLDRVGQHGAVAPSVASSLADLIRPYARYLLPKKENERSKVERTLMHAGYRSPSAMSLFFGVKAVLMISLPILVLLISPLFPRLSSNILLLIGIGAAGLGFLAPSMWLDHRAQARQRELRVGFPDAMDLLVVCVEAGLGLAPALQRVADDLMISYPELGGELALVNAEMRAGVERTQALKNLAERTGLEDIRGLVALLVQTMRFGTGIADALRVYSEEFRDKRMQAAEEVAAKMGTKMIFPLVVCLFPSFFLIAIGPAALALMATFKTMR